jgi:hypothetical protein
MQDDAAAHTATETIAELKLEGLRLSPGHLFH